MAGEIPGRQAHARLRRPFLVERTAGPRRDFPEDAVAFVPVQVIRIRVIRDVQVLIAVPVVVERPDREAKPESAILQARGDRRVHEAASIVPEEMIWCALEPERAERDVLDTFPAQRPLCLEDRIERRVDVGRDVHVEVTVAVRVEERRAGVPAWRFETHVGRNVAEAPVAEIPVQHVLPEICHEDVRPSIAVVVGDECARSPLAFSGDPGLIGHVLERAIGHPFVQRVPSTLEDRRSVEPPAVHEIDVEPPIAVVVEKRCTRAGRVEQVVLVGPARQQDARQSGLGRDVSEVEVRCVRLRGHKGDRAHHETTEGERSMGTADVWKAQGHSMSAGIVPVEARTGRRPHPTGHYFAGWVSSAYTACTFRHSVLRSGAFGAAAICAMAREESSSFALAALVTIT